MTARTVVSGSGRCGTSLVMQMLAAGGMPCSGDWPAYEDVRLAGIDAAPDVDLGGRVTKILAPTMRGPGWVAACPPTDWIWVTRNIRQMTLSQVKYADHLFGVRYPGSSRRKLRDQLRDENHALPWEMGRPPHRCLIVHFEEIIARPIWVAEVLASYLRISLVGLPAMASVVRPRSADCYPGLLEVELMSDEAAS
jgi:hypothetical protein